MSYFPITVSDQKGKDNMHPDDQFSGVEGIDSEEDKEDEIKGPKGEQRPPNQGGSGTMPNEPAVSPEGEMIFQDRMIKWFEYEHLEGELRNTSIKFAMLASQIVFEIQSGPERDVALRKLLEAKDAAVRATLHPGC